MRPLSVRAWWCRLVPLPCRSKQVIRDAIMDNNFLKNLDAVQVREIVDCMYEKRIRTGHFVIKEGDPGQHLYVAAGTRPFHYSNNNDNTNTSMGWWIVPAAAACSGLGDLDTKSSFIYTTAQPDSGSRQFFDTNRGLERWTMVWVVGENSICDWSNARELCCRYPSVLIRASVFSFRYPQICRSGYNHNNNNNNNNSIYSFEVRTC